MSIYAKEQGYEILEYMDKLQVFWFSCRREIVWGKVKKVRWGLMQPVDDTLLSHLK